MNDRQYITMLLSCAINPIRTNPHCLYSKSRRQNSSPTLKKQEAKQAQRKEANDTMKIGLIVYSQTGNTLQVANKLMEALTATGQDVRLEQITAVLNDPKTLGKPAITFAPDPNPYDRLCFAAPVQAFSLCAVMKAYLAQMPTLEGKPVACFVTQNFARPWLGGNHAIRQMTAAIAQKGGRLGSTGIINWSNPLRDEQIEHLISLLSSVSPDTW
jgi:hypothetical protein